MHTSEGQILFILTGAILLVGGIIGYFLFSLLRHFARHQQLQQGYNQSKLEALEKERQALAADLHDDIGPLLSATLYKLGEIKPQPLQEQQLLQEVREHINGIFSRLRDLSSMLIPRAIEKKGPLFALEEFSDTYLSGLPVRIQIRAIACPGLNGYRSLHLFRMLQEMLNNTIKHATAKTFIVEARLENQCLYIETSDDGIGFDPAQVQENPGLGLQHLAIRARMINARIQSRSWPGEGTRYTLEVPLTDQSTTHDS